MLPQIELRQQINLIIKSSIYQEVFGTPIVSLADADIRVPGFIVILLPAFTSA